MYSRRSRPRRDRRARVDDALAVPVELARVGGEERARRRRAPRRAARGSALVEGDVVVQEEDERRLRRAARPGCRGGRARGSRARRTRAPSDSRDLDAPVGRGAVDDDHLARLPGLGGEAREAVGEEHARPRSCRSRPRRQAVASSSAKAVASCSRRRAGACSRTT